MPKTVLEFLEEGRKALVVDANEMPSRIEDADATNALAAGKLIDEQIASMPERKAARLYAYDCVIAKLKAEAAKLAQSTPAVSNDAASTKR